MIVDCAVYEDGRRRGDVALEDACEAGREDGVFAWIGLHEPTAAEFDSLRREFALHELAVEDAIKAHQRPKLEVYGDMLFLVLKTVWRPQPERLCVGEILLFVGPGYAISVRHGEGGALDEVRARVEARPELLRCGELAVLYAIVDRVVDDYLPVIGAIEQEVEEVEEEVFSAGRSNPVAEIYELKRQTIELHRAVAPLVEPLERLSSGAAGDAPEQVRSYLRDVHDHALRAVEQIDAQRELLTSVLEANLTQVSVRQNEDMRRISAWVAIVAVPTMIAGIYGMNFEHMPELEWQYGYPAVLAVMAALCLGLYRTFRRSGWL